MSYLLDTCFLSELLKPQPDAGVVEWVSGVEEERLFVSVLSLGEIQKGIEKLKNGRRRRRIQTWLDQDLNSRFHNRILPLDLQTALGWGEICGMSEKNGHPLPVIDSLLAAAARARNLVLVTRNGKDFQVYPVTVLNPWNGA
ncbi:MAG TPA: type II toxin-antitoxin system VapC family toxin [Gammaproteobacteria bacterium]|nr:type II toxin-antitoxin system VapC family toxin [Gammaproteobacteria bacterium]